MFRLLASNLIIFALAVPNYIAKIDRKIGSAIVQACDKIKVGLPDSREACKEEGLAWLKKFKTDPKHASLGCSKSELRFNELRAVLAACRTPFTPKKFPKIWAELRVQCMIGSEVFASNELDYSEKTMRCGIRHKGDIWAGDAESGQDPFTQSASCVENDLIRSRDKLKSEIAAAYATRDLDSALQGHDDAIIECDGVDTVGGASKATESKSKLRTRAIRSRSEKNQGADSAR